MPPSSPTPLDTLVCLAVAGNLRHKREGADLFVDLHGSWTQYRLHASFDADAGAFHLLCGLPCDVPPLRVRVLHELLGRINEMLWLGNFILGTDSGKIHFRVSILLRGTDPGLADQLREAMETAVAECDRFYMAIHRVAWANDTPVSALLSLASAESGGNA